ncbi:hypothetical protein SHIRM173S_05935 [Streptomyces hirsutus]
MSRRAGEQENTGEGTGSEDSGAGKVGPLCRPAVRREQQCHVVGPVLCPAGRPDQPTGELLHRVRTAVREGAANGPEPDPGLDVAAGLLDQPVGVQREDAAGLQGERRDRGEGVRLDARHHAAHEIQGLRQAGGVAQQRRGMADPDRESTAGVRSGGAPGMDPDMLLDVLRARNGICPEERNLWVNQVVSPDISRMQPLGLRPRPPVPGPGADG